MLALLEKDFKTGFMIHVVIHMYIRIFHFEEVFPYCLQIKNEGAGKQLELESYLPPACTCASYNKLLVISLEIGLLRKL